MSQADVEDDDDVFFIYEEEEYSETSSDSDVDVDVETCDESASQPPSQELIEVDLRDTSPTATKSPSKRPSWIYMIAQALKSSKSGELHVTKIYECIENRFFPSRKFTHFWKEIIRTTLSRSRFFENVEGGAHRTAKVWRIRPDMMAKLDKRMAKFNGMKEKELHAAIVQDSALEDAPSCSFPVESRAGGANSPTCSNPILDHVSQAGLRVQPSSSNSARNIPSTTKSVRIPRSISDMITLALTEHGQLPISKIFKFISNKFPNYCNDKYSEWKLKVSKVLAENRKFVLIEKTRMWQIRPDRMTGAEIDPNSQLNLDRQRNRNLNAIRESDKAKPAQSSTFFKKTASWNNIDDDPPKSPSTVENKSSLERPLWTYSNMIALALKESEMEMLTAAQISEFICLRFPYYREATIDWRRNVRHELWNNRSFVCYGSGEQERNKNAMWQIRPENAMRVETGLARQHEREKVLKQTDPTGRRPK